MLAGVGHFHFVEEYGEPIASLKTALAEHNARDFLLVLPEAFNFGRSYYDEPGRPPKFSAAEVLTNLCEVAGKRSVVFVVSLLDPPHSSAYFVTQDGKCQLLARKKSDDYSRNYWRWEGGDPHNPIEYDGVCIGVMICNEVQGYAHQLAAKCDKSRSHRKLLCISARMGADWFGSSNLNYDPWWGKYVVLANSNPHGCGSFIADTRGVRTIHSGQRNTIVLKSWDSIDGTDVAKTG